MSLTDDPELQAYRAEARAAILENQGVMFRHEGVFTLGAFRWACRFSVTDPQKLKADEVAKLRMYADASGLAYLQLRVLKIHPDDTVPFIGAVLPWDDGTLEVLEWSQPSDFTGQRVGTCVLRRP